MYQHSLMRAVLMNSSCLWEGRPSVRNLNKPHVPNPKLAVEIEAMMGGPEDVSPDDLPIILLGAFGGLKPTIRSPPPLPSPGASSTELEDEDDDEEEDQDLSRSRIRLRNMRYRLENLPSFTPVRKIKEKKRKKVVIEDEDDDLPLAVIFERKRKQVAADEEAETSSRPAKRQHIPTSSESPSSPKARVSSLMVLPSSSFVPAPLPQSVEGDVETVPNPIEKRQVSPSPKMLTTLSKTSSSSPSPPPPSEAQLSPSITDSHVLPAVTPNPQPRSNNSQNSFTSISKPAVPKKKKESWFGREHDAIEAELRALRADEESRGVPRTKGLRDVRLWSYISEKLAVRGINRTQSACKNYWSREGRAASGFEERAIPTSQLSTSVQKNSAMRLE